MLASVEFEEFKEFAFIESGFALRLCIAQISIAIIVTIAGTMLINIVEHISHIFLHERFLFLTTFPRELSTNDILSDGESSILKRKKNMYQNRNKF